MFVAFSDYLNFITRSKIINIESFFRLRKPQDGLFMGTVDAYDTSNNTYRIRFDREALGRDL